MTRKERDPDSNRVARLPQAEERPREDMARKRLTTEIEATTADYKTTGVKTESDPAQPSGK